MRGTEFADLVAFATIVEKGSFIRAAQFLHVSPARLSQRIRALEDRLGIPLLNRTTRTIAVTDAGQHLLSDLRPAIDALERAVSDIQAAHDQPVGVVRFHTPSLAMNSFIRPWLGDFFEAFPAIELQITVADARTDTLAEGFDVGIVLGQLRHADLAGIELGSEVKKVAFASPDYVAKHGLPSVPEDLRSHKCIRWKRPGDIGIHDWEFQKGGRSLTVAVDGPLVVSASELAVSAAIQGVGIGYWAEHVVRPHIDEGLLVPILEEFCQPSPAWYLTYPRARVMSPAVRSLVIFLCERNGVQTGALP